MSKFYFFLIIYLLGHIPFIQMIISYDKKRDEAQRAISSKSYTLILDDNRKLKTVTKKPTKFEKALLEKISKEAENNSGIWKAICFVYFVFGAAYLFNNMEKFFN